MVALNPVQSRDSFSDRLDCHLVLSSTDNDGRAKFEDVDGSVLCFPRGPSSRKEVTKENFETSLRGKENGKDGRERKGLLAILSVNLMFFDQNSLFA